MILKYDCVHLDVFSEDVNKKDISARDDSGTGTEHMRQQPLPQGWSEKIDQQTGRPYYEWLVFYRALLSTRS